MFETAYQTIACRSVNLEPIEQKIKLARIENQIQGVVLPSQQRSVSGVDVITPYNQDVPAFAHPIQTGEGDDLRMVIDGRPYMRLAPDGSFKYNASSDYQFQIIRATLNLRWFENPKDLMNMGELPVIVFCRWLTQAIVKRFGLGPAEQSKVSMVTMFYWYSLHRDHDDTFDERTKIRILGKVSELLGIPTSMTMPYIDQIDNIDSIGVYCDTVRNIVQSERLERLNPAFVFAALGGSWFGFNGKEIAAVATEHPPTFYAIIATALNDRTYLRSTLGTMVKELDKKDRGRTFNKNAQYILSSYMTG